MRAGGEHPLPPNTPFTRRVHASQSPDKRPASGFRFLQHFSSQVCGKRKEARRRSSAGLLVRDGLLVNARRSLSFRGGCLCQLFSRRVGDSDQQPACRNNTARPVALSGQAARGTSWASRKLDIESFRVPCQENQKKLGSVIHRLVERLITVPSHILRTEHTCVVMDRQELASRPETDFRHFSAEAMDPVPPRLEKSTAIVVRLV